jgi:hypothetical protein
MSSAANRPFTLAIGSTPLITNDGSGGRRKWFGRFSSEMNSFVAVVEWSKRGVGRVLPGVLAAGACDRIVSSRLFEKLLLTSGCMSVLPIRLVTASSDHTFTPIACDWSCSRNLKLHCLA